eukprot:CAMPEP_0116935662 /NCGR_PEP_ID=MMETSP0467-20121206/30424_1 /TAXON_ID=283647 /ORGANISM="Mesodinium pulex, Strain SPMC105" /LENGTH=192 /DNA_ID=CAMNT_0004617093 /DNA_START=620 /DNA_END=1195 /DNA_ORIENTATION=+
MNSARTPQNEGISDDLNRNSKNNVGSGDIQHIIHSARIRKQKDCQNPKERDKEAQENQENQEKEGLGSKLLKNSFKNSSDSCGLSQMKLGRLGPIDEENDVKSVLSHLKRRSKDNLKNTDKQSDLNISNISKFSNIHENNTEMFHNSFSDSDGLDAFDRCEPDFINSSKNDKNPDSIQQGSNSIVKARDANW